MIILFIINALFAGYTVQSDLDIYRSIVLSEVKGKLEAKGFTIENIRYMDNLHDILTTIDKQTRRGWTDQDSVLLFQFIESMETIHVEYRRTRHYKESFKIIGYVKPTTVGLRHEVSRKVADYFFSRINLARSNFDADFFWWLADSRRSANKRYETMLKKYYCGMVSVYLR